MDLLHTAQNSNFVPIFRKCTFGSTLILEKKCVFFHRCFYERWSEYSIGVSAKLNFSYNKYFKIQI